MQNSEIYATFARYNRWMNEKLMDECGKLSDEERKQDRGAPFRSIHGLWNHVLLADSIWLSRFENSSFAVDSLGQKLFADWNELRDARRAMDERIEAFVKELDAEKLASTLRYVGIVQPEPRAIPFALALSHLFNHGTHHRGQISALMEQAGLDCGVTDLVALPNTKQF
jgi:uncharacterized damage-inducible protein DinB